MHLLTCIHCILSILLEVVKMPSTRWCDVCWEMLESQLDLLASQVLCICWPHGTVSAYCKSTPYHFQLDCCSSWLKSSGLKLNYRLGSGPAPASMSGASLVKEHSGIDPDLRERSLSKRFVPVRALSFFGIEKTSIPAVSVTWHRVCLQDGGIHVVSVELKFVLFAMHLQ